MSRSRSFLILAAALSLLVALVVWTPTLEHRPAGEPAAAHGTPLAKDTPLEPSDPRGASPILPSARAPARVAFEGRIVWPNGERVDEAGAHIRELADDAAHIVPGRWTDVAVSEGKFTIEGPSGGRYQVVTSRAVHYPQEECLDPGIRTGWWLATADVRLPSEAPVDFTLSPMESVRGRVFDLDGKSMRAFRVRLVPLEIPNVLDDFCRQLDYDRPFDSRYNCEGGAFEFVGLLPGEWEITVEEEGFARPVPRRIRIPLKDPIEFDLDRLVELNGRIEDARGESLRGLARARWAQYGASIAAGTDDDRAWDNGLFRLHVPRTTVELRATCDEGESEPLTLDLSSGLPRDGLRLVVRR